MQITAELSLYPLGSTHPIEEIVEFISAVREDSRIRVVVNQMSTQITGELEDVMGILTSAATVVNESRYGSAASV